MNRFNGSNAPGIAIDATKYDVAVELAKKQSQLSKWPDKWIFM